MFQKAQKSKSKLRLALCGVTGSGKTYSALAIASGLGKKIAVVDTECGSASLYADQFSFDVLELESFHPQNYIDAISAAEQAGYDVIVIDSLTHAWAGKDGALDLVDKAQHRQKTKNSFTAWKDVTPLQTKLVDSILQSKLHVITTMRSKMTYEINKEKGKTRIEKVGLAPIQKDSIEYEFTIVMEMKNAIGVVTKTRMSDLNDEVIKHPGPELGQKLLAWLEGGATKTAPAPKATQPKLEAVAQVLTDKDVRDAIRDAMENSPDKYKKLKGDLKPPSTLAEARKLAQQLGALA